MKIAELLLETGNQPYPLRPWRHKSPNMDSMVIPLPDDRIMEIFVEHERGWAVFEFLIDDEAYITGGGDQIRIFSTARQALIDWVQRNRPQYIAFTGSGEELKQRPDQSVRVGRISFYDRMARRLASLPEFRNWVNITERPDLWPNGFAVYIDQRNPGIDLKTYILASPQAFAQSR